MASPLKQIQGVKYDRSLLSCADLAATGPGGQIAFEGAKKLWESLDGKSITPTEKRTIEYILSSKKATGKATTYLQSKLGSAVCRASPKVAAASPPKDSASPSASSTSKLPVASPKENAVRRSEADSDSDDDDDDADESFSFDTLAREVVGTMQLQQPKPAAASGSATLKDWETVEMGLDVGLDASQLYLSNSAGRPSAFNTAAVPGVCALDAHDFSSGSSLPASRPNGSLGTQSREVRGAPVRPVDDRKLRSKETKISREEKLDKWFGMPKRKLTPEMEKELQVLKLRGMYDPKRFYKANDSKALPTHFLMATEVGGGKCAAGLQANHEVHWNSGRSFLDTVLRDQKAQEFTWKKHDESNTRGRLSFNSGHGKTKANGSRKGMKSTKRGGAWKKKKRG